ncbi:hypothetical protein [Asaia bogorensis]|uniref:hypothetical protein n=1 Tax=Asaia bogorensis TaxID=91915 RepID=UPI00078102A0|nr:hypothetical protein [Asaia bogorensis]GBQ77112.1 hypothetical protein AA0311_1340 [Asaia bogorensis NBRC 16594]
MYKYGKEIESLLANCKQHIAGVVDNAIVQSKVRLTEDLISSVENRNIASFLFSMENKLEYISFMVDDNKKEEEGRKISREIIDFFDSSLRAQSSP